MKKICVAACMLCFLCLHIPRGAVSLPFEGRYSFYVTEAVFPDGCDVIDAGIFYIMENTKDRQKVVNCVRRKYPFSIGL